MASNADAIPLFVNPSGGSAKAALKAVEGAAGAGFDVRITPAERLGDELHRAIEAGAPRVMVAGGDGTVSAAAAVVARTSTALAVLPGGTLNHFARSHGIPTDLDEALRVAREGSVKPVDVGYLNDQLFLNTSSVGVYVRFVQTRDRLERHMGYRLASVVAGLRILRSLRNITVRLELDREVREYQAPLVFVGVGERALTPPGLGMPVGEPGGALHVLVPRGRRQARRFARAYASRKPAPRVESRPLGLDTALVDRLKLELPMPVARVATDGEIRAYRTPLEYRLAREELRLVVPSPPPALSP